MSDLMIPDWVAPIMRALRPELRKKLSLRDIDDIRKSVDSLIAAERERAEKFMWQVRDTCTRAEKAEADRDRLRTAGRALLACPHIAERDMEPAWAESETEKAIAEMRAALEAK